MSLNTDSLGIVLQMKGMHIDQVIKFPFPTPPDRDSLSQAEKVGLYSNVPNFQVLEYLGALDKDHHITPLGKSMSAFPLLPRYSKMIILGQQFGNMPYIIAIVAGLSVGDPFLSLQEAEGFPVDHEADDGEEAAETIESEVTRFKRKAFAESREQFNALDPGCDVLRLLCAICAYEYGGATDKFCEDKFLRVKTMKDIRKLRIQITNIVNNQLAGIVAPVEFTAKLTPPTPVQMRTIKQVVTAAYLDHIAIRSDLLGSDAPKHSSKNILRVEYSPMMSLTIPGVTPEKSGAFIHPNSALARKSVAPEYVVYSDVRRSQNGERLRLIPLTTVSARDIEPLAKSTPLIQYSKPLNYPPPRFFSENGFMRREVYVVPRFGIQGRGWELPSIKRVEDMTSVQPRVA
jgi:ATP-dependent RNA helicase DHX37/DHR1